MKLKKKFISKNKFIRFQDKMFIKSRKSSSIFKKVHRIFKKIVIRRLDGPAHLRTPQAPVNKMHINWRPWRQIGNPVCNGHCYLLRSASRALGSRQRDPLTGRPSSTGATACLSVFIYSMFLTCFL